jgi:hypothetical protein
MHPPDADIVVATHQVIAILERLGIPYFVGGSLASSYHGIPRATIDGDLVIAAMLSHCRSLADSLSPSFVVELEAIVRAVHDERSFNAIHRELVCKVGVFIAKSAGWNQSQLARRQLGALGANPEDRVYVSTAEDTILAKLDWYRLGGGVSDRQWGDVTGVLKVQGERLDFDYPRQWAKELGVTDLLARALADSALTPPNH